MQTERPSASQEEPLLNAAVIGVGTMGRNHARVLASLPHVQLVAVADVDEDAARQAASTYRAQAYTDYRTMFDREALDLVIIAVPTRLHMPIALEAIERGIHCLIEKPIASSVEEGEHIVAAARQASVKVTVGHIERFNPAVLELKRRLAAGQLGRVFQVMARRVGPFPPRVTDVGVVFDLATHELNIMEYLVASPIASLYAETEQEIHVHHEDLLSGLLRFENGTVGVLDINWLTPKKIRELTLIGERGMFQVNYLTQELHFIENGEITDQWDGLVALMGVSEGRHIKYELQRREPLRLELEHFVRAVLDDVPPLISPEEALRAVYLAEKMLESGRRHEVVYLDNGRYHEKLFAHVANHGR
ncbi:MAG: gfo/Idh/MocA family oxidoreductase [Anaerolineae bacterium]|nr:MAG: gfo/Idh/MocA family oxidoreductase [Anaerolineae bacterium]